MSDGSNPEHLDSEEERHRALVDRLRRLRWPEPPPGARERRLEELREKLARGTPGTPCSDPDDQS